MSEGTLFEMGYERSPRACTADDPKGRFLSQMKLTVTAKAHMSDEKVIGCSFVYSGA